MYEKTRKDIWDPVGTDITKGAVELKIKASVSQRGWREVINIFEKRGTPVSTLKVAEVGSGSGAMALTFGLMGASVTLIDFNAKALERSRKIYAMYGCAANFLEKDCLDDPPGELINAFDLVISIGLAEHFSGNSRKRCIEYHRLLVKKGGVVFITVPNRRSLFYWLIRGIRTLTGTWTIDIEVPFSISELIEEARKAGFVDAYVIGYVGRWRDLCDTMHGLRCAISDCLPKGWVTRLKGWRARIEKSPPPRVRTNEEMMEYCMDMAKTLKGRALSGKIPRFAGKYCSELVLIAFK